MKFSGDTAVLPGCAPEKGGATGETLLCGGSPVVPPDFHPKG